MVVFPVTVSFQSHVLIVAFALLPVFGPSVTIDESQGGEREEYFFDEIH